MAGTLHSMAHPPIKVLRGGYAMQCISIVHTKEYWMQVLEGLATFSQTVGSLFRVILREPNVAQGGSRWPKVAQGGPRWPKVAQGGPRWPKVAQGGPRWPKASSVVTVTVAVVCRYC